MRIEVVDSIITRTDMISRKVTKKIPNLTNRTVYKRDLSAAKFKRKSNVTMLTGITIDNIHAGHSSSYYHIQPL